MLCSRTNNKTSNAKKKVSEGVPESIIFAFNKSLRQIVRIQHQLSRVHSSFVSQLIEFSSSYVVLKAHKSACGGFLSKMHRMSLLKLDEGKSCTWLCRDFSVEF